MNGNGTRSRFWLMVGYGAQSRPNTENFAAAKHAINHGSWLIDAGVSS